MIFLVNTIYSLLVYYSQGGIHLCACSLTAADGSKSLTAPWRGLRPNDSKSLMKEEGSVRSARQEHRQSSPEIDGSQFHMFTAGPHDGLLLLQLDRLLSGNHSGMAGEVDLWQALYNTVSGMVSSLEQLQSGQFNMTVSMTWLDPILRQLSNLSQPSASQ